MESMRSTWTDSRLDDLNGRVGELSRRMDTGFARVDGDITALRAEMNARFDSLQQLLLRFGGALLIALLSTILAFLFTAH